MLIYELLQQFVDKRSMGRAGLEMFHVKHLAGLALILALLAAGALQQACGEETGDLFSAAATGRSDRVQVLLGQGADVNRPTASGRTPLMGAAFSGSLRSARALLAFGADVDKVDSRGVTALMDAALMGHSDIVRLLLAMGADSTLKDASGQTALDKALANDKPDVAVLLQTPGADGAETASGDEKEAGAAVE